MAADEASRSEAFLSRWSRLKREQEKKSLEQAEAGPPPAEAEDAAPPDLPPVESLTPESDFSPFMQAKVQESVRRLALKQLFRDPHFNAPDLFEAYSGDWTGGEPIPPELLEQLEHAKVTLFQKVDEKPKEERAQARLGPGGEPPAVEQAREGGDDEPGRKDA